jgi:hypothetical protein
MAGYLTGAKGDDTPYTGNDGVRDVANCGPGRDTVFYKDTDTLRDNCEVKRTYK